MAHLLRYSAWSATPVTAALLAMAVLACSGGQARLDKRTGPLPEYDGELAELFDDQINPSAVGLSMEGSSPAHDPLLRRRAQSAELVARLRVQTVTRDSVGAKQRYVLSLQVGQPTLMEPMLNETDIELSITSEAAAFGIVRALESSLRGRTFIGFIKRFASDDTPILHWHLTADSEEVAQVIEEVKVLEELAGKDKE